jgi:PIN domain nuclease of toxin-antitoxin system
VTVVLDTHTWVCWVAAPKRLGRRARSRIAAATRVGVSAVSCLEVATAVARGRITLDRGTLDWLQAALSVERVDLIPLTPQIAVAAAQLGRDFPGDPADRVIAATAILESAVLVTKDRNLHGRAGLPAEW